MAKMFDTLMTTSGYLERNKIVDTTYSVAIFEKKKND